MTAEVEVFAEQLALALGIDPALIDVEAILDLAGDVAHAVVRPAAPVSTFLAGFAAGSAGGSRAAIMAAFTVTRDVTEGTA